MRYNIYILRRCRGFASLTTFPDAKQFVRFDGMRKRSDWHPPAVHIAHPELKAWDIFEIFGPSALVLTEHATDKLRPFFEQEPDDYELLPLEHAGMQYTVVNLLGLLDCLDGERSDHRSTGSFSGFAFKPERITRSLFKVSATAAIFTATDGTRPEWSFKYWVEKYNLKGIRFEPVWQGNATGQGRIVKSSAAGTVPAAPRELRVVEAGPHGVSLRWLAPASARCCFIGWSHDGRDFFWLFSAKPPIAAAAASSPANEWVEYTWRDETPKSGITYYRVIADGHAARTKSEPSAPVTVSIPAPADGDLDGQ